MGSPWNVSLIETAFADAAFDPSKWQPAMGIVAAVTESAGAILLPVPARPVPVAPVSDSLGRAAETYFRDGWVSQDLRYLAAAKLFSRGIITDADVIAPEMMVRSAYYQDFLGRHGLQWFGGVKISAGADVWCLSIQRSLTQGPFSREELRRLRSLSAPLSSIATLARLFNYSRAEGALAAFEFSALGAALVDRSARVIQINGACERLLGSGLDIRKRRFIAAERETTLTLDHAIGSLLRSREMSAFAPVTLPRSGSKRPLIAYAIRLPTISHDFFSDCAAMVVFVDMDTHAQPPEMVLQHCFGLSAAEARLGRGLASGRSLDEVASELSISKGTARHELKSIFAKLSIHRQSELTALLAKLR